MSNLNSVIPTIISKQLFAPELVGKTYYGEFCDCFSHVLTTNYSGLSEALFSVEARENRCTYLSSALWSCESLDVLTTRDVRIDPIENDEFVFPYLMTQAPIKPIVDMVQIEAYHDAIAALHETDCLVVLGYSFCDSDYHIASLVRGYIETQGKCMIYLDHSGSQTRESLATKLRVGEEYLCNIHVVKINDKSLSAVKDFLLSDESSQ